MAVRTGQSTTGNTARTKSATRAASSSTRSTSSTSSKSTSPSKSSSKKKGRDFQFTSHPFAPGQKVEVYEAEAVTVERSRGDEPNAKSVKSVTVHKNGDLKVSGLEDGSYVAVSEMERPENEGEENVEGTQNLGTYEGERVFVAFRVKDSEKVRKAKYERLGGHKTI